MTAEKLVAGPLRGQIEALRDNERRMANDCDDKESRQYNLYLCYVDAYNRVLELLASLVQGVQAYPRCEKCGKWRDVCICSAAGQRAEGAEAGRVKRCMQSSAECGQCELREGHAGKHLAGYLMWGEEFPTGVAKTELGQCKCYEYIPDRSTQYADVMTGGDGKGWTVTEDCPIHRAPPVAEKTELDQAGRGERIAERIAELLDPQQLATLGKGGRVPSSTLRYNVRQAKAAIPKIVAEELAGLAALGSGQELREGLTLDDYRNAPSGIGPLAAEWRDKPHRLVYSLCAALAAREVGEELRDALRLRATELHVEKNGSGLPLRGYDQCHKHGFETCKSPKCVDARAALALPLAPKPAIQIDGPFETRGQVLEVGEYDETLVPAPAPKVPDEEEK